VGEWACDPAVSLLKLFHICPRLNVFRVRPEIIESPRSHSCRLRYRISWISLFCARSPDLRITVAPRITSHFTIRTHPRRREKRRSYSCTLIVLRLQSLRESSASQFSAEWFIRSPKDKQGISMSRYVLDRQGKARMTDCMRFFGVDCDCALVCPPCPAVSDHV